MTISFPSLMLALQHGDSFFPSGAVAFSWGLEGLADEGRVADAGDVEAFAIGQLHGRWAGFDRPIIVAAHGAAGLDAVAEVDWQVEIRTAAEELRAGSRRMGGAMLSVFGQLGHADALAYRDMTKRGEACGHLAAMQGFLWERAGLDETEALALAAHGFCVGLLGAAIRLGCITHIEAQRIMRVTREAAARIVAEPVPALEEIGSFATESEIAVMRHASRELRLFAN